MTAPPAIPKSALLLGLAGVIPFLWGALTCVFDGLFDLGQTVFGARFVGPYVIVFYGTIILAFMSGVLWGFATKVEGSRAALGYGLSTLPALWAFFFVGGGAERALVFLIAGYLGLLALDYRFSAWGLTPPWWMRLRIVLTSLVLMCLVIGLMG
ncbi:DUF3429 domain-containing protein [Amaricoccus macauensis]|uniref:DUF3429 domain-containing protein n=1 Tax=Amaricoccus macauensis TaxID=57001 RepID=UPI003C7EC8AC